jgi:hypothetical protein
MSGLDILIRRLMTQRACLERAATLAAPLPGFAIQLGFGDGSAYDHLHEVMRRREIYVFDQAIPAERGPSAEHRVLGDPRETLPQAWERWRRGAALAHLNFPVSDDPRLAGELAPLLAPLLGAGAVIVTEQPMELPGWQALPTPEGVREGRHYLYKAS